MTPGAGMPWRVRLIGWLGVTACQSEWLARSMPRRLVDGKPMRRKTRCISNGASASAEDCKALTWANWWSRPIADCEEQPDQRRAGSSSRSRSAAAQHVTCVELPEDGKDERLAENRLQNAGKALAKHAARRGEPTARQCKRAIPTRSMNLGRSAAAVQMRDA